MRQQWAVEADDVEVKPAMPSLESAGRQSRRE
jgi:hypothetical protein